VRIQAGAGIAAFRVRPRLACGPYLLAGGFGLQASDVIRKFEAGIL